MTARRRWIWRTSIALGALILAVAGWAAHQRYVRKNFHTVIEGQVYRSAQPTTEELRKWKEAYGLRSVLTLQGWSGTRLVIEQKKVAEEMGLRHAFNYLSSDRLPSPVEANGLVELLETLPRPLLIHCRAGADRTGLASVMAAMAVGGQDYASATSQLSLKYLKLPRPGPDVNDVFEAYETHCRKAGAPPGGWKEFRAWLKDVYKPSYYHAVIEVPATVPARPGEIVTIRVRILNASHETLPLADPDRRFELVAFTPPRLLVDRFHHEVWGRRALAGPDLPPGGSMTADIAVQMPAAAGSRVLRFDLEEMGVDRFSLYGSPGGSCTVAIQ